MVDNVPGGPTAAVRFTRHAFHPLKKSSAKQQRKPENGQRTYKTCHQGEYLDAWDMKDCSRQHGCQQQLQDLTPEEKSRHLLRSPSIISHPEPQ